MLCPLTKQFTALKGFTLHIHFKNHFLGDAQESNAAEGKCFAVSDNNESHPCVFPFIIDGKQNNECVYHPEGGFWCSTKVNEHQEHMEGHWGLCTQGCPPLSNKTTITPLTNEEADSEKSKSYNVIIDFLPLIIRDDP